MPLSGILPRLLQIIGSKQRLCLPRSHTAYVALVLAQRAILTQLVMWNAPAIRYIYRALYRSIAVADDMPRR